MKVSKFQKFEMRLVHRSALKNAPYNPRTLDAQKRKRLQQNLQRVGLVEPIIWNERTGNLVGGHQRLAGLDAVEGHADYSLEVAVVQLTDAVEREQNVFLNNPAVQGEWDLYALKDMFERVDVPFNTEHAGFSPDEVLAMFPQPALDLRPPAPAPSGSRAAPVTSSLDPADEPAQDPAADPTAVLVFESRAQCDEFLTLLGMGVDERYLDGRRVLTKLGLAG